MKNQFFILSLVILFLSIFSCKEKTLTDKELEALEKEFVGEVNLDSLTKNITFKTILNDKNNLRARANYLENDTTYKKFYCGNDSIVYPSISVFDVSPEFISHSLTGGNPPIGFNFGDSGEQMMRTGAVGSCAYVGKRINLEVRLEIKVACNRIEDIQDMRLYGKLFENQTDISNNLGATRYIGQENNIIRTFEVQDNLNIIISKDHFVKCGSEDSCYIHVYVKSSFVPLINISTSISFNTYTFAFQLRDSDAIVHESDTIGHNNNAEFIGFKKNVVNSSANDIFKKSKKIISDLQLNTLYGNICESIPQTLAQFVAADNESNCGHMAKHTFLTSVPICWEPAKAIDGEQK